MTVPPHAQIVAIATTALHRVQIDLIGLPLESELQNKANRGGSNYFKGRPIGRAARRPRKVVDIVYLRVATTRVFKPRAWLGAPNSEAGILDCRGESEVIFRLRFGVAWLDWRTHRRHLLDKSKPLSRRKRQVRRGPFHSRCHTLDQIGVQLFVGDAP